MYHIYPLHIRHIFTVFTFCVHMRCTSIHCPVVVHRAFHSPFLPHLDFACTLIRHVKVVDGWPGLAAEVRHIIPTLHRTSCMIAVLTMEAMRRPAQVALLVERAEGAMHVRVIGKAAGFQVGKYIENKIEQLTRYTTSEE